MANRTMNVKLAPIAILVSSFIYLGFLRYRLAGRDALRARFDDTR